MCALALINWLKAPASHAIIRRWTRTDSSGEYRLLLQLPDPGDTFEFLVVGDTGDAEFSGAGPAPQDAVALYLAADAALPDSSQGKGRLLLHTGDVVYMTGERRLYDRNFRRPYARFLTPASTVDDLVFRLPFLPVPGNHDYYDFATWAATLSKTPVLGAGLRSLARELFAFNVPQGGSDMGRAFMEAFVARQESSGASLYLPGEATRVPNRYYQFSCGSVDFFALDSNTLEAPPPSDRTAGDQAQARVQVERLQKRARAVDRELRALELSQEQRRETLRRNALSHEADRARYRLAAAAVLAALERAVECLSRAQLPYRERREAQYAVERALIDWRHVQSRLIAAVGGPSGQRTLALADAALPLANDALKAIDSFLVILPQGPTRTGLVEARDGLERAVQEWCALANPSASPEIAARVQSLSKGALDIQRLLALEKRRARYRPDDFDRAQLDWLEAALTRSERERPEAWRVVYLHHPLYTTLSNHCEHPDIQGVRGNLLGILRDRVHAVIGGHAHAFEWVRSRDLPHTGLFVTGGGGQVSLRKSVLDPTRLARHRPQYEALRQAGVLEVAAGGRGPAAPDGQNGMLYHYLRLEATPDALIVRPVGVRRLPEGYRREEPMPVYHASAMPAGAPPWESRPLKAITLRRNHPPEAHWG